MFLHHKKVEEKMGKANVQIKLTQQPSVTSACKSLSVLLLPCQSKKSKPGYVSSPQKKLKNKLGKAPFNLNWLSNRVWPQPARASVYCSNLARGKEQVRLFAEKLKQNWGEPHSNLINAIMTYYSPPWCSPLFCQGKEQILNTINLERANCSRFKGLLSRGQRRKYL